MTTRLTLAEAKERIAVLADDARIDPASLDWKLPAHEAVRILKRRGGWSCTIDAMDAAADVLLAYQAHLDFEAGAQAERANASALLREQAAKFWKASADPSIDAERSRRLDGLASELRTMAAYIERGDRAEKP